MAERNCLREPIPEILEAADALKHAVDLHNQGNAERANYAFARANCTKVREWTESIWGIGWAANLKLRTIADGPPTLKKEERISVRMPNVAQRASLIARDGYHCRFCGIPVVPDSIRKQIAKIYPVSVPWARHKFGQHAGFQAMWMQFDHVLAHARGGDNSPENVIITCAPCNFAKFNYTLDELGLVDPRTRPAIQSDWIGLTNFRL